jgi:hypothetical protein
MWLVSVYESLSDLSGGTLSQASLLSRATASNIVIGKTIGLMKWSSDCTPHWKVAERQGYSSSSEEEEIGFEIW